MFGVSRVIELLTEMEVRGISGVLSLAYWRVGVLVFRLWRLAAHFTLRGRW